MPWTDRVDLGGGYSFRMASDEYAIAFKCPHREGTVPLQGELAWTMEQREPLTLSPSINCTDCGCHGFIRAGRWVAA